MAPGGSPRDSRRGPHGDPQIPWAETVDTLVEHGYTGYLSSEYEGGRTPYRSVEQVRRQHALLRSREERARNR
jgi:sugar phosphate isomerase/epimerase